ncbi:MAG: hypothetical protein OEU54_14525, partial [Gemmatimonadota bacterium]|nr:hypothetical protein [Gemmatimonadota bacterium]
PGAKSNNVTLTEWFVVPFSGMILDSRILTYSFEARPRFSQNHATDLPQGVNVRDLGIAAAASLFSGLPVSLDVVYNRTSGVTRGGFGTEADFGNSALFSVLSFKNVYLPMNVSYSARSSRNAFFAGGAETTTPVVRSDAIRTFRISATNSKLNVVASWSDQTDRIGDNDFSLREMDFNHRFGWGKGSMLQSRVGWSNRRGNSPYDRHRWDERLRIRHTRSTASTWTFGRFRTKASEGPVTGTSLGWQMDSRALSWLTVGANLARSTTETDEGGRGVFSFGPSVAVRTSLPAGIRFNGNAAVAVVRRSADGTLNGLLEVVNEVQVVDETFLVILDRLFSDPASIVVRSEDQSIVYALGIDYSVVVVGSVTQLRILPGSRIQENDRILVSYSFAPQEQIEERGVRTAAGVGLAFRGLSVRHSRSWRDTDLTGDFELPVSGDFQEETTIVAFRGGTPLGQLRATLSRRRRDGVSLSYATDEASVVLGVPAGKRLQLFLDANARRVEDESDEIRVLAVGASGTLALGTLSLDGGVRLQDWHQRMGQDEIDLQFRGGARWHVGRFDARARAHWDRRQMPGMSTIGLRVYLDLTRRF